MEDTNTKDGDDGGVILRTILVGGGGNGELLTDGIVDEPAPSAALDGGGLGVELLDELLEGAEGGDDLLGELRVAVRKDTSLSIGGCEDLPEETVVGMASSVEAQGALERVDRDDVALGAGSLDLLESDVQVGDVRLVVLLVVDLHDPRAHDGLQGRVIVGQVGQGVDLCWFVFFSFSVLSFVSRGR